MVTKELVGKLSPDQQEILAEMEFCKTQQRLKLLAIARGQDWRSRYFPIYIVAVLVVLIILYSFDCFQVQKQPAVVFLPVGVTLVCSLCAYIARIHRRLDAMLELMESDREESAGRKRSN